MDEHELLCFEIIATTGNARSLFIEAIQQAKIGHFHQSEDLITEGNQVFLEGHVAHLKAITQEANGKKFPYQLLLMHAEDQLMSAEMFSILAREFIDIYKKIID